MSQHRCDWQIGVTKLESNSLHNLFRRQSLSLCVSINACIGKDFFFICYNSRHLFIFDRHRLLTSIPTYFRMQYMCAFLFYFLEFKTNLLIKNIYLITCTTSCLNRSCNIGRWLPLYYSPNVPLFDTLTENRCREGT